MSKGFKIIILIKQISKVHYKLSNEGIRLTRMRKLLSSSFTRLQLIKFLLPSLKKFQKLVG